MSVASLFTVVSEAEALADLTAFLLVLAVADVFLRLLALIGQRQVKVTFRSSSQILQKRDKMPNSPILRARRRAALRRRPLIVSHQNGAKSSWDWMMMVLSLYVAVVSPYNATFVINNRRAMFSDVGLEAFFIVDIVLNFRTTYVSGRGKVVSKPRAIAINYVKTWFIVDLLAALPFDMLCAFDACDGEESVASLIPLLKLMHMLRLLRFPQKIKHSRSLVVVFFVMSFAFLLHCLSCVWYVIGVMELQGKGEDWKKGWINKLAESKNTSVENLTPFQLYLKALYITTSILTTVGCGNVSPGTTPEMIFTICGMLTGVSYAVLLAVVVQYIYSRPAPANAIQRHGKATQVDFQNLQSGSHAINIDEEEVELNEILCVPPPPIREDDGNIPEDKDDENIPE